MKPSMVALLLPKLECLISWMALCVRGARDMGEEDDIDEEEDQFQLTLLHCTTMFCDMMNYDTKVKAAMQASTTAAQFLAFVWTLTDEGTDTPLLLFQSSLNATWEHGCIINAAFMMFTGDSLRARFGFLRQLFPGGDDLSAVDKFIRFGIERLKRMRLGCELQEWEPLLGARDIKDLLETFNQFLTADFPHVVRCFHDHSSLRTAMSTVCSMTSHISSMKDSTALAFPVTLLLDPIQEWPSLPGASTLDAMCQLFEGGLVSTFVDILVGGPLRGRAASKECISLCWSIFRWIAAFSFYPSTYRALQAAIARIDESLAGELMERKDSGCTTAIWCMLKGAVGLTKWVKGVARMSRVCDNITCVPDKLDRRRTQQKACVGCHSAIYCSEACQKVDWVRSHHEDCRLLQREYIERNDACTWISSAATILHLSLVQEVFRLSVRGSFLEAAREKSHPDTPLAFLVASLNFGRFPVLTEEQVALSTVPEFLKRWGKLREEGGLGEFGRKRLEFTIKQFLCQKDVRLVHALFRLKDESSVWLLARIRIPKTEEGLEDLEGGIVVGGFSSLVSAI